MIFSTQFTKEILYTSNIQRTELQRNYKLIPETQCRRGTLCCSMLPEMTLIEALAAINRLAQMNPSIRLDLIKKIASYFFLNPVEIRKCPFLNAKDCLIYQERFFGCRAYGLWSKEYYEKLSTSSRKAKEFIRRQWRNLGVSLPNEIIEFQVPYCLNVKMIEKTVINDEMLLSISYNIQILSESFNQLHQSFRERYFSDLSFLITSLIFGVNEAVRMKFAIVSDIVNTGNRERLERIIQELPDLFA